MKAFLRWPGSSRYLLWVCVWMGLAPTGCTPREELPPEVVANLDKAAGNRAELEAVIAHYRAPADSLKRRAALFLIAHMDDQGHVDTTSIAEYNRVIGAYDSLVQKNVVRHQANTKYDLVDERWARAVERAGPVQKTLSVRYDLLHISAGALIRNIDDAFTAWQTKPWARHVTFDQFCEYILPYKYEYNPIDDWRPVLAQQYAWVADSLVHKNSSFELVVLMSEHLKWFIYNPLLWERKGFSPYGIHALMQSKSGNCANKVNLNIYAMRALGVAVTRDYTPFWANRNWGHGWNAFVAEDGRFLDFEGFAQRTGWGGRMQNRRQFGQVIKESVREENPVVLAKVFRVTYSKQRESLLGRVGEAGKARIPALFHNSRYQDVSSEYFPVSDVAVDLYERFDTADYAYICTYNNNNWVPVHWGKVMPRPYVMAANAANPGAAPAAGAPAGALPTEAVFTHMGRNVLYLGMYYQSGKYEPASPAFILRHDGTRQVLRPDRGRPQRVRLEKTHPTNPDDHVRPGNHYELFYWDDKWVSLGKKKAAGDFLQYDAVPENALLWLLHVNRTEEEDKERVFTIENGRQRWW